MAHKLSDTELSNALGKLADWQKLDTRDAIFKSFKFSNFSEAFSFMTRVALKAEQLDHHPEWTNIYSSVQITLSTHSANGVTALDIQLATFIEEIY